MAASQENYFLRHDLQLLIKKTVSGLWAKGPQATTAFSPKGPCPAGFSRSSGHMRALKINVPNTTYIATVTFGDQKQDKVSWYMRS
ncbi:hypothetical protein P5673_026437, partial [Acropora cervicornis]